MLEVEQTTTSDKVTAEAQKSHSGYTLGKSFDIDLYLIINNDKENKQKAKLKDEITVSIEIPNDIWHSNREYKLLHNHNGKIEAINGTASNRKFTFNVKDFSEFAFIYKTKSSNGGGSSSSGGSSVINDMKLIRPNKTSPTTSTPAPDSTNPYNFELTPIPIDFALPRNSDNGIDNSVPARPDNMTDEEYEAYLAENYTNLANSNETDGFEEIAETQEASTENSTNQKPSQNQTDSKGTPKTSIINY